MTAQRGDFVPPPTAPEGVAARLDELARLHAAGTADGEWRAVDNGDRHGPENRYEILDDEGSVAVCSDDNDATATTGADRTALIVASVNALPDLIGAVRAVAELAAKWRVGIHILDEIDRFEVVEGLEHALTSALSGRDDHTEEAGR